MSLSIDEYLSSISALQTAVTQSRSVSSDTSETKESGVDSYIASAVDSTAALPCENYNDILKVMQSAKAESSGTSTSSESAEETEEAVSGTASSGGGGGESGSEEETTTEVVTINGVTYLETTTTTDGVTTVTRTVIGGKDDTADTSVKAEESIVRKAQ